MPAIYAKTETRPEGQLAVAFFRQTYAVRLFREEQLALDRYPSIKRDVELFLEPHDLAKRFSPRMMRRYVEKFCKNYSRTYYDARDRECAMPEIPEDASKERVAEAFWGVLQTVGDLVSNSPGTNSREVYRINLEAVEAKRDEVKALPKQARQIVAEFERLREGRMSEKRARDVMYDMYRRGTLKTRQDPWRILCFYAGTLYELGILDYPGRRDPKAEEAVEGDEDEISAA